MSENMFMISLYFMIVNIIVGVNGIPVLYLPPAELPSASGFR